MASAAEFELDAKQALAIATKIKGNAPRLISRSINKSAKSAKTAMVKATRENVGLAAAPVRKALVLKLSRPGPDPAAVLSVSKKRIPLIEFKARQLKRAGVKANLKGGARTYAGAFIATMRSGHRGVFRRREHAPRLPVVELRGPSLARVFRAEWAGVGVKRYREQIAKNLAHEMKRAGG